MTFLRIVLPLHLFVVVGIGLMTLVFYSSRAGYDEPPHQIGKQRNPSDE
jgi:hypothetical protein